MSLHKYWEYYKKNVISADATELEISRTKKDFYAGGAAVFKLFGDMSDPQIPQEEWDRMVKNLVMEFNEHVNDMLHDILKDFAQASSDKAGQDNEK